MIVEKYISLPGGVVMTLRPNATVEANKKVFSLPNIHGDVFATLDANGSLVEVFNYDPFGNPLNPNPGLPANAGNNAAFGWLGQHQKVSEVRVVYNPIQMGSRVYYPAIGRFTSIDPVEGGVENSYVYPPDPVNDMDTDGQYASLIVPLVVILGRSAIQATVKYAVPAVTKYIIPKVISGFKVSSHTAVRQAEKKIADKQIAKAITKGEKFNYVKDGRNQVGYYDKAGKTFVGTFNGEIRTVIGRDSIRNQYILNLKRYPWG